MSEQTHSIWNAQLMRSIIDSVADGVFIVDPRGLVSFWNPSMEKISGFTAREAMGKPCTLIACSACSAETSDDGIKGCHIIDERRSETVECLLRHKSGVDVPVIKKSSAVTDDQGRFLGVVEAVTDISELKRVTQQAENAARQLGDLQNVGQIVGKSRAIQLVFSAVRAAAASDATILIQGESGTGKELVAGAIHYNSDRRKEPFVTVNCSALSESLLESELFGHVRGAYTGAVRDRTGRFEEAEGGTIFLDEIGELSPYIQVKLLRVLQEREIERVGESTRRRVDIRVITATNRDLRAMVQEGSFREDLYYRLKVFPIDLPPLRGRKDDIPLLVDRFIERMNEKTGKQITDVSAAAMKALLEYHWPGNIRELENAIEYAFVLCNRSTISHEEIPVEILEGRISGADIQPRERLPEASPPPAVSKQPTVRTSRVSREELLELLHECHWNKKEVGRRIGVSHTAVWKYMKKWEIPLKKP